MPIYDTNPLQVTERILEISGVAEATPFSVDAFRTDRPTLQPHQLAKICLSTGIVGEDLASEAALKKSPAIRNKPTIFRQLLEPYYQPGTTIRRNLFDPKFFFAASG